MYVDPPARAQHGTGAARTGHRRHAHAAGYQTLAGDAVWMVEAHALYRSLALSRFAVPDPEFGCFPGCEHLGGLHDAPWTSWHDHTHRPFQFIDPPSPTTPSSIRAGPDEIQLELQHDGGANHIEPHAIGDDQAVLRG